MRWSAAKQNATPAQFRRMLTGTAKQSVELAIRAGRLMAAHLLKANNHRDARIYWSVRNLSREQIEQFRKAHGVPRNRVNVMLAVAWSAVEHPRPKMIREKKVSPEPTFWRGKKTSLGHRGGAMYRSYVRRQQESLNLNLSRVRVREIIPTPIRRSQIPASGPTVCIQPVCKPFRRLPNVTLIKFVACGHDVPIGGTVFCERHSPRSFSGTPHNVPRNRTKSAKPEVKTTSRRRMPITSTEKPRPVEPENSKLLRVGEFYVLRAEYEKRTAPNKRTRHSHAISFADLAAMQGSSPR
jgi:hypothetical protein